MEEIIKLQIEELIRKLYHHRLEMVVILGSDSVFIRDCEEVITDLESILDKLIGRNPPIMIKIN